MSMRANVGSKVRQIREVFTATRRADPKLLPLIIGIPLVVLAVFVGLGFLIGVPVLGGVLGFLFAVLAASAVFGRRATATQFQAMEGQVGAAAAVLQSMRGTWVVTPAVAFTRKQDLVHMVVGRPGVVLVGEGSKARTTQLLKQEQRKVSRAVGDTPVQTILVGDGEGQVPLRKLRAHVTKLRPGLKRKQIPAVNKRLEALGRGDLPVPKGPMPQGVKAPRPRNR